MEHSFGQLKSRFRCLLKRLDVTVVNVNHVVIACLVLHNICKFTSDEAEEEWKNELLNAVEQPEQEEYDDGYVVNDVHAIRRILEQHLATLPDD